MPSRALLAFALALAGNAMAGDPALRTLFHTATEREELDRLRRGEPAAAAPAAQRPAPVLGGFVKRSDGRDTVWLDGRPVTGPEASRLADPARMREAPRNDRRAIDIKPTR